MKRATILGVVLAVVVLVLVLFLTILLAVRYIADSQHREPSRKATQVVEAIVAQDCDNTEVVALLPRGEDEDWSGRCTQLGTEFEAATGTRIVDRDKRSAGNCGILSDSIYEYEFELVDKTGATRKLTVVLFGGKLREVSVAQTTVEREAGESALAPFAPSTDNCTF